ncbi:MAG: hypothetical protein LBU79_09690 [Planctomycetota bacterium]|nr:hypothetical protein [Planctomycetota bacterium]
MSATTIDDIKAQSRKEGELKGIRNSIVTVLTVRFGEIPIPLKEKVLHCQDLILLKAMLMEAADSETLDEFKRQRHLG